MKERGVHSQVWVKPGTCFEAKTDLLKEKDEYEKQRPIDAVVTNYERLFYYPVEIRPNSDPAN